MHGLCVKRPEQITSIAPWLDPMHRTACRQKDAVGVGWGTHLEPTNGQFL